MKNRRKMEKASGFTLLEMMIALSIFALLMLYVTQFMKLEIGTFNQAAAESALEAKARSAMMHILDEVRLHKYTYFQSGSTPDGADGPGIYYYTDPVNQVSRSLVDLAPGPSPQADIYYEPSGQAQGNGELYYQKPRAGDPSVLDQYLIADQISSLTIQPVPDDSGLVEIDLIVGGKTPGGAQPYELISWIRLN